jgi:hypothetical protein
MTSDETTRRKSSHEKRAIKEHERKDEDIVGVEIRAPLGN